MLKIHNSLTGEKQEFKSLRPGDTVDFSIDASNFSIDALEEVIIGVSLLNYDQ